MNYDKVKKYHELGLGIFIHWGLYSIVEKGEWYWKMYHLDKNKYAKLVNRVNELDINFDKLIKLVKQAGGKYACLTTRHHDGFSLYDTKGLDKWDINLRKDKRDFVKEFVSSCRKYKIVPILYHTTLDWQDERFDNNFNEYLEYLNDSIKILCTNYGNIGGFWFDGNWAKKDVDWKEDELYKLILKYQPNAIIANNTGMKNRGILGSKYIDVVTYEQGKLSTDNIDYGRPVVKEVCQTLNDHWGYAANDFNHKNLATILSMFIKCRHFNANYLLNVGPNKKGNIPQIDVETLKLLGEWLNKYGEPLYKGNIINLYNGNEVSNDFIVKYNNQYYLYLSDIKSGGHVNAVEYGSNILEPRSYQAKDKILNFTNATSLDNKTQIKINIKQKTLTINPIGFEYGFNTIYRVYRLI